MPCLYLLLIILMPLLPAFVLFRYLPESSKTEVDGPFHGFSLKLGGAFAGYFVAALLSWQVAASLLRPIWFDNWTLNGQVVLNDLNGHASPAGTLVMVKGPASDVDLSGALSIKQIPIARDHDTGFPRLVVMYNGYQSVTVPLDPDGKHVASYGGNSYDVRFDKANHSISINKPIVLTKGQ
jgi:hypothetical protein